MTLAQVVMLIEAENALNETTDSTSAPEYGTSADLVALAALGGG